ncbi:CLUMA_CG012892, isoform A [Clunio marinus]|uniref:CLUMA_CG012892, isoform A n=1 Tax=Clunio marinus TaxID=568069 RepID=A0A1J1IH82_9DIPT|nr:CLUMA_CG012892, isoform A [Clunio marinus]
MFNSSINKPPAFPLHQPVVSDQLSYNWNIKNMPWKSLESGSNSVVLFNGINNVLVSQNQLTATTSGFNMHQHQPRIKRRSESEETIPTKQFISEEKMIAHLNSLHLSENFQQHNINSSETNETPEVDMERSYHVNLTPQELEQRLKRAQRITVCDEVRKNLKEEDEIIPKVLLNRVEEPCKALILWRPPEVIQQLVTFFDKKEEEDNANNDFDMNNDLNNNANMEMDL